MPVVGVEHGAERRRGAFLAGIAVEAGAALILDKRRWRRKPTGWACSSSASGRDSCRDRNDLMLVCGEPSGDALGAQLMAGLKQLAGDRMRFTGVGGLAMAREGLQSLYPLDATAVMGLREVVPAIPADSAPGASRRWISPSRPGPTSVVVIDSPDFTHRVARGIKQRDPSIRTVDYVAPQVWASRAYRAKAMAQLFRPGAGAVSVRGAVLREIWLEGRLCRPSGDRAGGAR